jgi:hypothetical protein
MRFIASIPSLLTEDARERMLRAADWHETLALLDEIEGSDYPSYELGPAEFAPCSVSRREQPYAVSSPRARATSA